MGAWWPIPRATVAAVAIWVGSVLLTMVAEAVAMYRFPKGDGWPTTNPPLPDYGFDWIPYRCFDIPHTKAALPDLLVLTVLLVTAVRFVIFDDRRWTVLMRFCLIDAFLLYLRCLTEVVTSLNNPNPRCANCGGQCPTSVWNSIVMMIEHFPLKLCGGLIYSGHTCYFTLCAELWRRYSTSKFMVPAIWSTAAVGLYVLVSCRYHYTVDIILALAIALMACVLYHGQVDVESFSPRWKTPSLPLRLFLWFEREAGASDGSAAFRA